MASENIPSLFEYGARLLARDTGEFSDYSSDLWLFFGVQLLFFVVTPLGIMLWRLLLNWRSGFMAMFKAPVGRHGNKRSPASALRFWLFEQTPYGYYMDIAQAAFSAISCIMFISVAYAAYDPDSVQGIEFFFTLYFFGDFLIRLYIAQDSLKFFLSLVSLLDFITVVPAIVTWLMSGLTAFETDVQVIVQCIRVMRVFRIFRVIRVIRVMSVSQSYAFQRQVFVLVMTVLSLVFAAAGLFQIFESSPGKEYPFHKAVYYAAITVIGRPGVPFTATITAVFLTVLAMSAATIIPTFVAELIRLWYDNAALDKYAGNPEAPHTIVCGDTNASRLRVLVSQYFHPSRDPNTLAPIIILAEGKPEGALRALLEQHKHSGNVRYIRGSGRRTADLRRAAAHMASTCIVLNYRSDKDAAAADTEVLSTVMAVKNVNPKMRVLAQLHRARKRNQLKLVPGFSDGDRAIAAMSLGATLIGLGTHMPGFATFITNLIRRGGTGQHHQNTVAAATKAGWAMFLYGEAAKPTGNKDVDPRTGRPLSRTPLDEYAASFDAQVLEVEVTPRLVGRTFAAAARVAYLRYNITLIGATVPVNEELLGLVPGMPRTFRLALFPADTILSVGMKLYAIAADESDLELFRVETGGRTRNALEKVADSVKFLPFDIPGISKQEEQSEVTNGEEVQNGANIPLPGIHLGPKPGDQYGHNNEASKDIMIPWCFKEQDLDGGSTNAFLRALHIPVFASEMNRTEAVCETCRRSHAPLFNPTTALSGCGIVSLGDAEASLAVENSGSPIVLGAQFDPFSKTSSSTSLSTPSKNESERKNLLTANGESSPNTEALVQSSPTSNASSSSLALSKLPPIVDRYGRRPSLGDDGFGGIDDTDDVVGVTGPLMTQPPPLNAGTAAGIVAAANSQANMNSLGVRLALPSASAVSEDITLVVPHDAASGKNTKYSNHVLILGVNDNIGYILRAIGSMLTRQRNALALPSTSNVSTTPEFMDGDQYDLQSSDVVILAAAKPADGAINAMYAGSSRLLNKVTFITGNPADASELLKAGAATARAAIVLTQSKPAASADGSDNLSDDTEAIMITATLSKLAPSLHVITEILHGSHAPFIRPVGSNLNDAQRSAFAFILEERETARQRQKLDDAVRKLETETGVLSSAFFQSNIGNGSSIPDTPATRLLGKLIRQQVRLRSLQAAQYRLFHGGRIPVALGRPNNTLDSRTTDGLQAGRHLDLDGEIDVAFSNLTNAAIVDVLVGVREDFGNTASMAANDGASFSTGGGGGGGGSSKGSGATNDLYTSPAFAAGRVFSFATMDSIITEARFEPYIVSIVKQLVRAARRQRLVLLPVPDAVVMARLAEAAANVTHGATGTVSTNAINASRRQYFNELVSRNAQGTTPSEGKSYEHYGEVFEVLLRCWRLLPVGIYRRVHPAMGLKTPPQTTAAVAAASGLPSLSGDAFTYNRALVSYMYTSPPPNTRLSEHDLLYVLHIDEGDEDGK